MDNLKFRRQFLLTPEKCDKFEGWRTEKLEDYFLYVHPDCQLEKSVGLNNLYLVGYFCDPHNPKQSSKEILDSLSQEKHLEDYIQRLYTLVGRFVLIIEKEQDIIFFNDACGLKTVCYSKVDGRIYAASQPLLMKQVLDVQLTKDHNVYFNSDYVKDNIEHWLPSGITFYQNMYHLVPNHYLKVSEYIQKRYYPIKNIAKKEYGELKKEFSVLLKKIVNSANYHMDLAFSLTAGWDSRILLSSSRDIINDIDFYTLRYRDMGDNHNDIKIPVSLSKLLKFKYNIYECRKEISEEFAEIYKQNTDMAHINDWGKIAYGMSKTYPQQKVAVKGNCSEIGRCFYFPNGTHKKIKSEKDFFKLEQGWDKLDFIKIQIQKWYSEVQLTASSFGYDLYDLFYWEHRMGSWQAQSQLEWDIVQEVFTPFNSRELLDILLAVSPLKRKAYKPEFYTDSMQMLWSDVLLEPINPLSRSKKMRKFLVAILKKMGVFIVLKNIMKKM